MKFKQLEGFVFDSESGVIGAIAGVDFIKQTITILTNEDETVVAKLANAEFLEKVGAIGSVGVINHDVVVTADGKLYEIALVDSDSVQLHLLSAKLERVEAGDIIAKTDLHALAPYVTVIGNIHELEPANVVDFNIKVVRMEAKGEIKFFYACNNVAKEEIDLIKVVFVGHNLLKEEDYERITMTHEVFLEAVEANEIKETEPQALLNLMRGKMMSVTKAPTPEPECVVVEEEEDNVDGEVCTDCGEHYDYCVCTDEENEDEVDYDF